MYWLIILVIVFILGVKLGSTLVCGDLVLNKRITLEEYNLYKQQFFLNNNYRLLSPIIFTPVANISFKNS